MQTVGLQKKYADNHKPTLQMKKQILLASRVFRRSHLDHIRAALTRAGGLAMMTLRQPVRQGDPPLASPAGKRKGPGARAFKEW